MTIYSHLTLRVASVFQNVWQTYVDVPAMLYRLNMNSVSFKGLFYKLSDLAVNNISRAS